MERRKTKKVKVGSVYIGGDAPVSVQSMLNKPAHDFEASVKQAVELEKAGCQVIRGAIPAGMMGIGEPLIYGVTLPMMKPCI